MEIAAGSNEDDALEALKDSNWRLESAFELYFHRSRSKSSKASSNVANIDAMFNKYKVNDHGQNERIEAEGIIRLCQDLSLDPMDPVTLVLSMKMNADTMGQYTKEEFHRGMRVMGSDDIDKLKAKIPALRSEYQSPSGFKNVYEFSFHFAKEPNAKALALDTAIAMWKVLMGDKWCFNQCAGSQHAAPAPSTDASGSHAAARGPCCLRRSNPGSTHETPQASGDAAAPYGRTPHFAHPCRRHK